MIPAKKALEIIIDSAYNNNNAREILKALNNKKRLLSKNPNFIYPDWTSLVKTNFLDKFKHIDRADPTMGYGQYSIDNIDNIAQDLKSGYGLREAGNLQYTQDDLGSLFLRLGEGNHRLSAAKKAGISELPITISRTGEGVQPLSKILSEYKPLYNYAGKSGIKPENATGYIPGVVNANTVLPMDAFDLEKIINEYTTDPGMRRLLLKGLLENEWDLVSGNNSWVSGG